MHKIKRIFKNIGPGLLYAGAAVGVSHLVQSTRAGASYGFGLLWVLIVANIIKYPFFEFATRYTTGSGKSLIDAYKKIGKWALLLYLLLTLSTMFAVTAAISTVTAGLFIAVTDISLDVQVVTFILLLLTAFVLIVGRFSALENIIKIVIIALAISTIVAVLFSFKTDFPQSVGFNWINSLDIAFLIAFIGWMPAPFDITVWQSSWTLAKQESQTEKISLKTSLRDFNIGYIGTALLAIGFLLLGAFVMYGSNETFSASGVQFSKQLINMYTQSIGSWAYWIVAIAALTTMFSTSITVLDAYPRVLKPTLQAINSKLVLKESQVRYNYIFWLLILIAGTMLIIIKYGKSMQFLVDLATTISFVTAPILAILNFMAVTDKSFTEKPKRWLKIYAWIGIVLLIAFTVFYIIWKFF